MEEYSMATPRMITFTMEFVSSTISSYASVFLIVLLRVYSHHQDPLFNQTEGCELSVSESKFYH